VHRVDAIHHFSSKLEGTEELSSVAHFLCICVCGGRG
jgi:hypothetical protein